MMQPDLYEREAAVQRDMLNLSENDSPRHSSFRMTSPFNQRSQVYKTTGTAPPKNRNAYSRYDYLKVNDAVSDENPTPS